MSRPLHVDVFADPGLPSRAVSRVLASADNEGSPDKYRLTHNRRQIPLRPDGTLDLDEVRQWARRDAVDLLVVVTEIPRRAGRQPKMAALHFAEGLAVISLPALGWRGLTTTLRRAMFDSLDALSNQHKSGNDSQQIDFGVVHEQDSSTGRSAYIASPWWRPGRLRLVLGMVRTNEPLAAVPKLSGVLAAASATGAFGIFYSSIWKMADALPSWRLGVITIMAVLAMVVWLIASNRLWESPRHLGSLTEAAMYNASTVVTLLVTISLLYVTLFSAIFLAGAVVIESGFMAKTIGSEVSFWNYIDIAWLSASMGTVAGALGSNFDDDEYIRNLTHGRRQAQRFKERLEAEENEGTSTSQR